MILFHTSDSAKILGFFVVPSISHQYVYRTLMYELSKRGHKVTIVTPNPIGIRTDNYTEVSTHDFSYKNWRQTFDFSSAPLRFPEGLIYRFSKFFIDLVDKQLSHEPVRRALHENRYDLVFAEFFLCPSITALSYKYKVPLIGISSLDNLVSGHLTIGNPVNPSYMSATMLPYSDRKTFWERLRTTLLVCFSILLYHVYVLPKNDVLARKHFGEDLPYIGEIERNASLLMVNTDFVTGYPRPYVPAYIPIGGGDAIHMRKNVTLPKVRSFMKNYLKEKLYHNR